MRDPEIRRSLLQKINNSDPAGLVIEELGLCEGVSRIDIAVLGREFVGYEIKSAGDSLERLSNQINIYGKVLDKVDIVCAENHLRKIEEAVPSWWGIQIVKQEIIRYRESRSNPDVDPYAMAQLLWRNETLSILAGMGLAKGNKSKPRRELWALLSANVPIGQLREIIVSTLKSRNHWRSKS